MFETSINRPLWQRFRGNWRSKQAWRFSCALGAFAISVILFLAALSSALWILPGITAIGMGMYFFRTWRTCNSRLTVAEALQRDPRPPILYLRPFKADNVKFTTGGRRARALQALARILIPNVLKPFLPGLGEPTSISAGTVRGEELIVSLIESLGPVIAIGRPKESIPQAGAARLYVGDEWKDVVHDLLNRSQLILLYAGSTAHFEWELAKVFHNDPFVPTVLILPFFQKYDQSKVDAFVARFYEVTGLRLSRDLEYRRAVYFPSRLETVEVWNAVTEEEELLNKANPFAGAIAHIMEIRCPGWSEGYASIARDLDQWADRLLVLVVCFGILAILLRMVMSFQ